MSVHIYVYDCAYIYNLCINVRFFVHVQYIYESHRPEIRRLLVSFAYSEVLTFLHLSNTPPTGWVYVHKYKIIAYMNIQLENHEAETINLK